MVFLIRVYKSRFANIYVYTTQRRNGTYPVQRKNSAVPDLDVDAAARDHVYGFCRVSLGYEHVVDRWRQNLAGFSTLDARRGRFAATTPANLPQKSQTMLKKRRNGNARRCAMFPGKGHLHTIDDVQLVATQRSGHMYVERTRLFRAQVYTYVDGR